MHGSSFATMLIATILLPALHTGLHAQTPDTRTVSPATTCAAMREVNLPDIRITQATAVAANTPRAAARVAHCRVAGVIGRDVAFVAVLPDAWNERLVMAGNGGYAGSFASLTAANSGYLAVTTNTGHTASATSARWALNDPQKQIEFGNLAVHQTVDVAKLLARSFYGTPPRFAYFDGCSNGGRQGLMEAQRFPNDFDAIVAGAPAYDFTTISVSFLKNLQALFPPPGGLDNGIVSQDNLRLVSAQALALCDARDGVADGVIDDPRRCAFKVSSIKACPADAPAPDCLTAAQRGAIEKVYAPTVIGRRQVYPGQPIGGEAEPGGWAAWITGTGSRTAVDSSYPTVQAAFAIEGYKYFLTSDSTWNYAQYDIANWEKDNRGLSTSLDAVSPDLSRFAAHGGKLLMYHGWSDPALNPLATIDYYEQVLKRDPKAAAYVRLFLMPGVLHCVGGAGPDQVAWLAAVRAWREDNAAPERLVATKSDNAGRAVRTRPLCPYPQHAVYSGTGSTDDAANFACREP